MDVFERLHAFIDFVRGQERGDVVSVSGSTSSRVHFSKQNGLWRWVGVPTNNYQDKQKQIITAAAHQRLVRAIDNGLYKRVIGKDAPELWLWHLPVPVGVTEKAAWDDRGFLVVGGTQLVGEFYDAVFDGLARYQDEHPGELGMSLAAEWPFFTLEDDGQTISEYLPFEFTFLPVINAANALTAAGVVSKEQAAMKMRDDQREFFAEILGDRLSEFDMMLEQMEQMGADLPRKEIGSMSEQSAETESAVNETEPEVVAEVVTIVETETETVDETEVAVDEPEEVVAKEEDAADDSAADVAEVEAPAEAPEYVTAARLQEVVDEFNATLNTIVEEISKGIAEGVAAALGPVLAKQDEQDRTIATLQKDREDAFEKAAREVEVTPLASISARISQSIVGRQGAMLKEDELLGAPLEKEDEGAGTILGIPSIDKIIKAQRGNRSVVTGR